MDIPVFGAAKNLKRRAEWIASQTYVVLSIQVPKANEKTPVSAEQFFSALHGIYRGDPIVQEHIGFEIVACKDSIIFYVFTPLHLLDFIEGQLYAQYPDLVIRQVTDYTKDVQLEGQHVASCKIQLTKEDVYPIKTFAGGSADVDPLASITAVLSGLEDREQAWVQIVVRPIGDKWQDKGVTYVQNMRTGKKPSGSANILSKVARFGFQILQEAIQPGAAGADTGGKPAEPPKLSAPQEAALKGVESKITKLGYETLFRMVVIAPDVSIAKARIQAILAAYKQYNTTNLNGFIGGEIKVDDYSMWQKYISREFEEKGNVLNIEELASVYHFPMQSVETSAISWAGSKKGEAPFNLPLKDKIDPKELTVLGRSDYRNHTEEFGIKLEDRKRHIYVIGKSGTGKSTLLENMVIDDVWEGRGVIVVDPHGELADKVVESIPESRIKDVIILDPADREFPISFNPLEKVNDDFKGMVASGFVGIFKKIFGNSWGPRLEYILRNTVLALLDSDNPTMLGIPRMLTEAAFRNQVIDQIKDTVIRDFWVNEFGGMDAKQRSEAIAPILNKVGQFLSTSTIRNIVGQPTSTIDIRRIMDEEKILIVNLSKGKIGEDNMALLGAMIITKVQLAAMSRANVSANERPNCFLYVDEFQNFATESFATILSEARKYNLGLTIAHQYIAQMSEEVRDAVIGNVGTMFSFRVGGPDADVLVKEFAPVFDANDLLNLQKYHAYIKLLIDGIAAPAFSVHTLPPRPIEQSYRDRVVEFSRVTYARPRLEVENHIEDTGGYKQKREAEAAAKQAKESLQSGNQAIGIRSGNASSPQPASNKSPQQQPAVVQQQQPVVQVQQQPVVAPQPTQPVTLAPIPVQQVQQLVEPVIQQVPIDKPVPTPTVDVKSSYQEPIVPTAVAADMQPIGIDNTLLKPENPINETILAGQGVGGYQRKEKPLKVIYGWAYKEVAQRGGLKWYLGEPEKEIIERQEQKRLAKEAGISMDLLEEEIQAETSPLPSISPTEQRANAVYSIKPAAEDVRIPIAQQPQRVVHSMGQDMSLHEGQSISLP